MQQMRRLRGFGKDLLYPVQVGDERALLSVGIVAVAKAQEIGGVYRDEEARAERRRQDVAAFAGHAGSTPGQCIKSGSAHGHDQVGGKQAQLCCQPPGAALNLAAIRAFMQPPLAALFEFEMFDGVRHITLRAVDAGFLETLVEETAGWSDEGSAFQVLLIAGLLTDENHARFRAAFAENQLGGVSVEITSPASLGVVPEGSQRGGIRATGLEGRRRFSAWPFLRHGGFSFLAGYQDRSPSFGKPYPIAVFRVIMLFQAWAGIANFGHPARQRRPFLQICTVTYSLFSFIFPLLI